MDWDDLYRDPKFCLKEPAEEVVQVVPLFKERKVKRILDLGFGAGRHIIYLAKMGFELYGVDISRRGAQVTSEWLTQESLHAELVIGDMTAIPYSTGFFDACVCRGVITHNTVKGIRDCIAEIYRTLAPQSIVVCTFISRDSSEYRRGEEIEPNTFTPLDGIEAGVPHHFVNKAETQSLMRCFKELGLHHMRHEGLIDVGTPYVSAHWVFVGEK